MSSPSPQVGATSSAATTSATGAQAAATAAANPSIASGTVSSMADLKEQAPEVYKAMMQGIAMNICRDMEHHQARLHKLHEEFRRQAQGG